ncbi:MAG TPA: thioredoxin [Terrimesophilobacter sp.]|nr:thioredoxin [Terrimesophilobacter sp.]
MKVDLYSSSFCGACTATRAALTEAVRLVPDAELTETNIAHDPVRAEAADIRATPTVVISTDDGTEVFRAEGVPTIPQVLVAFARAL